jgi:hypothetical protein
MTPVSLPAMMNGVNNVIKGKDVGLIANSNRRGFDRIT